ncbi:hypothetical protein HHK36_024819 [Tetracentron sinense]|uniref:DUF569 domain-containing protein n=1 Tax=Tetracentron sinense TaxID=13715 RepID=A0A834YK13_TETSI|nr:hypothetical protein HHK36_024819 [Tetracentron sinense]
MTGNKVLQAIPTMKLDSAMEWEPIRDGCQVKLRSLAGKFLCVNGGPPPWRSSITHDTPLRSATKDWVLWKVDDLEIPESESFTDFQSPLLNFPSMLDSLLDAFERSHFPERIGMELFHNAKAVRLRSHHDKYLLAEEDGVSVSQDRDGSSKNASWTIEFVERSHVIRLKSCFGKYLTASNSPFLLGMAGRKVLQTLPTCLDSSVEWEPLKEEGSQIKLKTRYGNFLRANGGLPPWRNSITHDIPNRTSTQDWILWDVDIVEIRLELLSPTVSPSDSTASEPSLSSSFSIKSLEFSKLESSDSFVCSSPKVGGRNIYYNIADENGDVVEASDGAFITFKGTGIGPLTNELEEETGRKDIVVCSRSPVNGMLYPLRLHLPPGNRTMHVVLV